LSDARSELRDAYAIPRNSLKSDAAAWHHGQNTPHGVAFVEDIDVMAPAMP
jgi:hypothetical protein